MNITEILRIDQIQICIAVNAHIRIDYPGGTAMQIERQTATGIDLIRGGSTVRNLTIQCKITAALDPQAAIGIHHQTAIDRNRALDIHNPGNLKHIIRQCISIGVLQHQNRCSSCRTGAIRTVITNRQISLPRPRRRFLHNQITIRIRGGKAAQGQTAGYPGSIEECTVNHRGSSKNQIGKTVGTGTQLKAADITGKSLRP